MSRYGKKHKSFYTVTLGNMTTTNISKAHTENNRMSGYREAGGREEGREEGRGRREGETTKWARYIWIPDGLSHPHRGDITGRSEPHILQDRAAEL